MARSTSSTPGPSTPSDGNLPIPSDDNSKPAGATSGLPLSGAELPGLNPFEIADRYRAADIITPFLMQTDPLKPVRDMKIQVVKQRVEATTRKLSARWSFAQATTINMVNDPYSMQNARALDEWKSNLFRRLFTKRPQPWTIEDDIAKKLAAEISKEIDDEILKSLRSVGGP